MIRNVTYVLTLCYVMYVTYTTERNVTYVRTVCYVTYVTYVSPNASSSRRKHEVVARTREVLENRKWTSYCQFFKSLFRPLDSTEWDQTRHHLVRLIELYKIKYSNVEFSLDLNEIQSVKDGGKHAKKKLNFGLSVRTEKCFRSNGDPLFEQKHLSVRTERQKSVFFSTGAKLAEKWNIGGLHGYFQTLGAILAVGRNIGG
jgi:hypothetical protein